MKDYSATTGTAIQDDSIEAGPFAYLPLTAITPSPANPRKTFTPARMAELVDSIRASGVHQPILVRPLPGSRVGETDRAVQYEIVVGERRYRASLEAGAPNIPAMIRALSDEQALEVMLVENVLRDDLTPLEEAEGYEHLMQHTGLSADELGAKVGKSRSYIYAKLKLLDLCQEVKQALRDGTIDASRALLIARIPDGKLQIKALTMATTPTGSNVDAMGVRAFSTWLQQNVMLRLEHAPFQITDAHLAPAAGPCTTCPKRTGAAPDLFADVASADLCTDPACHAGKVEAHRAQLVATAQKKGLRVIDGAEAKEVFNSRGSYDSSMAGYSRLDQVRNDVVGESGATLRKLLAGEDLIAQGVQPVLIEHPRTKELIEAVPTAEAEALLITRGLLRQSKKAESVEREIQQLKDSMERSVFRQAHKTMWQTLVKAVHASSVPVTPSADLVRAWLVAQCDHLQDDDLVAAFDLPDIEGGDRIEDRARMAAQRIPSVGLWKAVVILMMAEDQAPGFHLANSKTKEDPPHFTAVANMLGVDLKPIEAEARATIKAQTAEEIKALKAQIAPKPKAAPTPAADVDVSTGGKGAKVKKADAPLRKPKTSAAEAQASIAAAMQAEDQKTEPGADAQGIEATASGFALAVGARVTVLPSATGPKGSKWIGKTGTVERQVGPEAWDVCFTPMVAKPVIGKAAMAFQSFHVTELEVEQ